MEEPGVVPDDARFILGSMEVETGAGRRYRLEMLRRREPAERGEQSRLRIFASEDGVKWSVLPMKLDLRSRFWTALVTTWPPPTLDEVSTEGGLVITYHDDQCWEWFDTPPGFLSESLWKARYDERKGRWSLSRVRVLTESDWPKLPNLLVNDDLKGWPERTQKAAPETATPKTEE